MIVCSFPWSRYGAATCADFATARDCASAAQQGERTGPSSVRNARASFAPCRQSERGAVVLHGCVFQATPQLACGDRPAPAASEGFRRSAISQAQRASLRQRLRIAEILRVALMTGLQVGGWRGSRHSRWLLPVVPTSSTSCGA